MDQATFALLPGISATLNVIILLSAVFFFTSTLASHILEALAGWVNSRGKQQRRQLKQALVNGYSPTSDKPKPEEGKIITKIYSNPFIASLETTRSKFSPLASYGNSKLRLPSYIKPELLAHAISATYVAGDDDLKKSPILQQLAGEAKKNGEPPIDKELFEKKIIDWFKSFNERQNGAYTRWSFSRLFLIGLVMAALMDIDTFHIAGSLWNEPQVAENLVSRLEEKVPELESGDLATLTPEKREQLQNGIAEIWEEVRSETSTPAYAWQKSPALTEIPGKALGWLLTALATSLGAQFWFNLMSEALKLRATGSKPDDKTENDKQASKSGDTGQ